MHAMNARPRSVTVICWIFIVFGSIALLTSLVPKAPDVERRVAEFKASHPFQFALLFVGPVLAVTCGIFMLFGFGWARWLFHTWFGHVVFSNVVASPIKLLLPGILFAVAVYCLYRPDARAFFQSRSSKITKTNATPVA
jgi:hypothetical protein